MLFSINENDQQLKQIQRVPHEQKFQEWCDRLTNSQLETIRSTLQTMIDEDEVHTSTWMPGNDWTETPWFPIYEDACDNNFEDAAKCFGIFVWEAFMNHPASWSFIRLDMSGRQFAGLTYFRIRP